MNVICTYNLFDVHHNSLVRDSTGVDFSEFSNVAVAFSTLFSEIEIGVEGIKFKIIRNACMTQVDSALSEQFKNTQDTDSLFQFFAENKAYCNWLNIHFLEVIANASGCSKLKNLVKNYKEIIYSKTLKEVWSHIPQYSAKTNYYSELKVIFNENPDMTVEKFKDLYKPYLIDGVVNAMLITKIKTGSLEITLLIPTDKVYQNILHAIMLPQSSRTDSYLQIGDWIVHHPRMILQNLHKEYR